jgi:membrane protein DedA with SNARE-associated domain
MSLPLAVLAATAGNLVGSLLAYALGASAIWAAGFVLSGMLAASAWATVDSVVGHALLALGLLTLAASILRGRRSR